MWGISCHDIRNANRTLSGYSNPIRLLPYMVSWLLPNMVGAGASEPGGVGGRGRS